MFLAGFITGFIVVALIITLAAPKLLFIVSESRYNFDETVEKITEAVGSNNWKMPHQYDLQQIMANNGFTVSPVKVLSLCKPDLAVQILDKDDDRHVSSMMPCRISVYQKADGRTYVSRINSKLFARIMGGNAEKVMGGAGDGVENIVKTII